MSEVPLEAASKLPAPAVCTQTLSLHHAVRPVSPTPPLSCAKIFTHYEICRLGIASRGKKRNMGNLIQDVEASGVQSGKKSD